MHGLIFVYFVPTQGEICVSSNVALTGKSQFKIMSRHCVTTV